MMSHVQVSHKSGGDQRGACFYRGDRKLGGDGKQRVHGVSLAELLLGKKRRRSFFPLSSAVMTGFESFPFWSPNSEFFVFVF